MIQVTASRDNGEGGLSRIAKFNHEGNDMKGALVHAGALIDKLGNRAGEIVRLQFDRTNPPKAEGLLAALDKPVPKKKGDKKAGK